MLKEKELRSYGEHHTKLQILDICDRMQHAIDTGEVVNIAFFTLSNAPFAPYHRMTAFRLIGAKSPEGNKTLLLESSEALTEACA
jgi:hypothetical protein